MTAGRHLGVWRRRRQHGVDDSRGPARRRHAAVRRAADRTGDSRDGLLPARDTLHAAHGPGAHRRPARPAVRASERHAFRIEIVADGLLTPWGMTFCPMAACWSANARARFACSTWASRDAAIAGTPAVWAKQDGGLLDIAIILTTRPTDGSTWRTASPGRPRRRRPGSSGAGFATGGGWGNRRSTSRRRASMSPTTRTSVRVFSSTRRGTCSSPSAIEARWPMRRRSAAPTARSTASSTTGACRPTTRSCRCLARSHDLESGQPQCAGAGISPGDRRVVVDRARSARRRRAQRDRAGRQLRLAVDHLRHPLRRHPDHGQTSAPGLEQPSCTWTPSVAPSGIAFYTGDRFPGWRHDLFIAMLLGNELRRVTVNGHAVTHQETIFKGFGRVRHVITGPDGLLYVALNDRRMCALSRQSERQMTDINHRHNRHRERTEFQVGRIGFRSRARG